MKDIIRREFLDHIQSLQFAVLLVLTIILFAVTGLIFVKSYSVENESYQKHYAQMQNERSTVAANLYRGPNSLLFIAEGRARGRPSGYYLSPKGVLSAWPPSPWTFKLPTVAALDWSFIIGTLFSLYVILIGFQAISGEKEQGTLRLVLANPIGRIRLLGAKYLSILLIIMVPLVVGSLVNLVIIGTFAPQVLTLSAMSRIIVVFLLALAYVSLFALLSLFFSAFIPRSSLVLLVLLAVWVLFAFVIPSSSVVLAEKLSTAPREIQSARMFEPMVQKEVWAKVDELDSRSRRGEFKTEEEVKKVADRAFMEGMDKIAQFHDNLEKAERARAAKAKNLSRLSPASLLQYASEDIIQSGDAGEEEFLAQVRAYSRVYDQYVLKKVGKLVQTSGWRFSGGITFKGKMLEIQSPWPQEYQGDKSDFPMFVERSVSLGAGLKSALFDLAGLIIWNLILAGLAFSAFLRADVR